MKKFFRSEIIALIVFVFVFVCLLLSVLDILDLRYIIMILKFVIGFFLIVIYGYVIILLLLLNILVSRLCYLKKERRKERLKEIQKERENEDQM